MGQNKEANLVPIEPKVESQLMIDRPPELTLAEASKAAQSLKKVIDTKGSKVVLGGKTYLQFEDWLTVARFYGITCRIVNSRYCEYDNAKGFEARAEALLVVKNQTISTAEAMCLSDEPNWRKRPLFMLRSMAQTRASAKALRQCLSWVVVLAGYQPTPAEEMDGLELKTPQQTTLISSTSQPNTISDKQIKRLYALSKSDPHPWSNEQVKELVGLYPMGASKKYTSTTELSRGEYDKICLVLESKEPNTTLNSAKIFDRSKRAGSGTEERPARDKLIPLKEILRDEEFEAMATPSTEEPKLPRPEDYDTEDEEELII